MYDLYDSSVFECAESPLFLDGSQGSCRNIENECLLELRDVYPFLLKIGVLPDIAARIELSSTSPVGISSSYD